MIARGAVKEQLNWQIKWAVTEKEGWSLCVFIIHLFRHIRGAMCI